MWFGGALTLVPEGRVLFTLQFAIESLKDLARTYIRSLRGTKPLLMHGSVMSLVDVHGVIYIRTYVGMQFVTCIF